MVRVTFSTVLRRLLRIVPEIRWVCRDRPNHSEEHIRINCCGDWNILISGNWQCCNLRICGGVSEWQQCHISELNCFYQAKPHYDMTSGRSAPLLTSSSIPGSGHVRTWGYPLVWSYVRNVVLESAWSRAGGCMFKQWIKSTANHELILYILWVGKVIVCNL